MQVTLNRIDLMDRLSVIEKGLPGRSHFAPIEGIYMESKGDKLVLCSNNLEMAVRTVIPVMDIGKDATILPKKFIDIIKQLPDVEVDITLKDNRVVIKSGKSKFKLNCSDADKFPLFDDNYESNPCITLDGEALKDMISKTTFCVSSNLGGSVFHGVLMENVLDDGFFAIASDTYRLVLYERLREISNQPFSIIVPGKLLSDIGRIVKDDDIVKIYIGDKEMVFVTNEFEISVRLLEGKYPEITTAILINPLTRITVNKQAFVDAVSRAKIMAETKQEVVALSILESLDIKSQSEEGKMAESLPFEIDGEQLEQILLNAKFILEGAKIFGTNDLHIEFNGSVGAVIIVDEGLKYLMLPIRKN